MQFELTIICQQLLAGALASSQDLNVLCPAAFYHGCSCQTHCSFNSNSDRIGSPVQLFIKRSTSYCLTYFGLAWASNKPADWQLELRYAWNKSVCMICCPASCCIKYRLVGLAILRSGKNSWMQLSEWQRCRGGGPSHAVWWHDKRFAWRIY